RGRHLLSEKVTLCAGGRRLVDDDRRQGLGSQPSPGGVVGLADDVRHLDLVRLAVGLLGRQASVEEGDLDRVPAEAVVELEGAVSQDESAVGGGGGGGRRQAQRRV